MSQRANKLEQAMCFVDGGYLHIATTKAVPGFPKALSHAVLDALRQAMVQRQAGGIFHYYDWVGADQSEARASLLNRLRTRDYFTVHQMERWERPSSGRAATLAAIMLDMVDCTHRDHFDHALLLAGDRALVGCVERVLALGKQVHVFGFSNDIDNELMQAATTVSVLTPAHFHGGGRAKPT